MNDFSTPAGWYADGDGWERRWDGSGWTDERRRKPEPTQVRPATPPPNQPPAQTPAAPQPPPAPQPPAPVPPTPPPGYGRIPSAGVPVHQVFAPAPPPPPLRQRRGRLGLWLTLAVVLVLGVGAALTLALLQPWSGDDGGDGADDPGGPGEPAKAAVQGDVDGDGKGDALYYVYLDYDDVTRVDALSNGNGFELEQQAVEPYSEPAELFLDWNGDGVNEPLTWKFVASGKQVTLSSTAQGFPGDQTFTLSLASLKEYDDLSIQVVAGDFDGDGDQDLAVAGPNDRVVDVSVLLNDGKGTFSQPTLWLSVPNAVIDATRILPGDFDGDGDTDLWAQLPADRLSDDDYTGYYSGDRGYALLTSTGKSFTAGAVAESDSYFEAMLAGDVTGDGTAHVVGVTTNSTDEELTVTVYDVSSGRLEPVRGFTGTSKIGQRSLQGAILSDVDGDGRADLVFVVKAYRESKFTGVQVMRSTGTGFDSALVWAETPACDDDNCRLEFVDARRY